MDDLGMGGFNAGNLVNSGMDALTTVILWLLLLVGIGVIIFLVYYLMSFKHKVRLRKIVKGRVFIIDDRAKEVRKDGAVWWKLLKTKIKQTAPPESAIEITKKGKLIAEGYLTNDDRIVWRSDVVKEDNFKEDLDEVDGDYRIFGSEERALYIQEMREAETYKKKNITDLIAAAAPYLAIIIILVCFLIFFNDVVQPVKELADSIQNSLNVQKETANILKDIIESRQSMLIEGVTPPN